jgi:CheY-like chemotaxis protein
MICVCETGDKDWVLGDSHRMQQILTNVITNAIKYTATGSITLSMKWRGGMLRFECIDTGPGIPKEDQASLFMRFVQRGGAPGSGLGLAIAKHLVDLAGGTTGFESDPTIAPGTTCFVELPLELCIKPESVRKAVPESMIEEPITFLLIDDILMNRTMFRRRIKKGIAPKAELSEASTGEEALEICKNKTFDIIIIDQHMEEAGGQLLGTDTVVTMRQRKIASFIIGCSGNDIEDEFVASGCDWAIGKPTPPNKVILKQLQGFLTKRRQTDNLIVEEGCGQFRDALQTGSLLEA